MRDRPTTPHASSRWLGLPALLSAIYFLSLLLKTGYISDDAFNSLIGGTLVQNQISLWERTWSEIAGWTGGAGRFFPLSTLYTYPLFYFVRSLLIFKLVSVGVILGSVVFFALFLGELAASSSLTLLTILILPTLFQFRVWHDPLLGFAFLLPLVMLGVSLSFWSFGKFLGTRGRVWWWIAVVAYAMPLMTYEVSYLLCACYPIIAWETHRSFGKAWRDSRVFLGLGVFFVALSFALKSPLNPYFNHGYRGVAIRWHFPSVYRTFFIQTYSAFPLSYFLRVGTRLAGALTWKDLIFFFPFSVFSFSLLRRMPTRLSTRFLFLFGLALAAIPAVPLALSSGQQDQLMQVSWGYGYLPVYLQYFGVFVLFLGLFQAGSKALAGRPRGTQLLAGAVAMAMTGIGALTLGQNRLVVHEVNRSFKYPRQVLQAALESGFLDAVPEGSIILRNVRSPGDHTWAYSTYTGKIWLLAEPSELIDALTKMRQKALPKSAGALRMKDAFSGVVPLHPVPAIQEWAEWLPIAPKSARLEVDLSKWQVYGLTYSYDDAQGLTGTLYITRLDRLIYDPRAPDRYSLRGRDLRWFEYATKRAGQSSVPAEGLEFRTLLDLASKAPVSPEDH